MTEQFANFAQSSLSAAITATQTTISVANPSSFPLIGNFRIVVQSFDITTQIATSAPELMLVTAVAGKQFTVQRGIEGTQAIAFASGAQVAHIITAGVMQALGASGVSSINNLIGAVTLTSTSNTITITPSGDTIDLESSAGPAITYQDTLRNILANDTPTSGALAWATDYEVLLTGNGTNWYVDSSYLTLKSANPDIGYFTYSNRIGYSQGYVTDKEIDNCWLGENATTNPGALQYNATGNAGNPSVQVYLNGAWVNFVTNLNLIEAGGILEQSPPVGYISTIQVFSGNSTQLGLNGIPLIQGYQASIGAYPVLEPAVGGYLNVSPTPTQVTGSTSGSATFQEPAVGTGLRIVIINLAALLGTASFTFQSAFANTPVILSTSGLSASLVTSLSTSACTITGATSTGVLILMGL